MEMVMGTSLARDAEHHCRLAGGRLPAICPTSGSPNRYKCTVGLLRILKQREQFMLQCFIVAIREYRQQFRMRYLVPAAPAAGAERRRLRLAVGIVSNSLSICVSQTHYKNETGWSDDDFGWGEGGFPRSSMGY